MPYQRFFFLARVSFYSLILTTGGAIFAAGSESARGSDNTSAILLAIGTAVSAFFAGLASLNNAKQSSAKQINEMHGAHFDRLNADNEALRKARTEREAWFKTQILDLERRHKSEVENLNVIIEMLQKSDA